MIAPQPSLETSPLPEKSRVSACLQTLGAVFSPIMGMNIYI